MGGDNVSILWGGHICYEGGHRAHGTVKLNIFHGMNSTVTTLALNPNSFFSVLLPFPFRGIFEED